MPPYLNKVSSHFSFYDDIRCNAIYLFGRFQIKK